MIGESEIQELNNEDATAFAETATDEQWFAHILRGYYLLARECPLVFSIDGNRRGLARVQKERLLPFCNLYMAKEQVAIAEAQKQLAEQQTKLAKQQKDIAKRIEHGSDRTMTLTQRITCLTYVLAGVGIITFAAVCVQIAIQMQWIGQ